MVVIRLAASILVGLYGVPEVEPAPVIALTETAQFCLSKVLTVWLRH
jgi:hypothetical protein